VLSIATSTAGVEPEAGSQTTEYALVMVLAATTAAPRHARQLSSAKPRGRGLTWSWVLA